MTLAFLQSGDQLRTNLLCSEGVCVEALTDLSFHSNVDIADNTGFDSVNECTIQILKIICMRLRCEKRFMIKG